MKPIKPAYQRLKRQSVTQQGKGMSTKKSLVNRRVGEEFEKMIEQANVTYENRNLAYVAKTHPEVKTVRDKQDTSKFDKVFRSGKGEPDFVGMIQGGKHIEFEAKTCEDYEAGFKLANIKDHQLQKLRYIDRNGGHGFVLVSLYKLGEVYLVTMDAIAQYEREQAHRKVPGRTLSREWLIQNTQRVVHNRGITYDYLDALDRTLKQVTL